ncbi:hypothetical protein D7D25_13115 [Proteiniphilum sp. X52]|nr:hypothetical protein D7D25_13115 [Proteiniphilum sp. X52]
MELSEAKSPTSIDIKTGGNIALVMIFCDNDYHARFIRLFYFFLVGVWNSLLIMLLCENSYHARFYIYKRNNFLYPFSQKKMKIKKRSA